ncbi:MAG: prepilin-type N-terminal cleavage/methylation domain-containing protein, partial [Planctomycetes bacterium]|nr:prepilin-type N-terminal cleavage/methylation domain-containing protein [Planctomycetota bacterium]
MKSLFTHESKTAFVFCQNGAIMWKRGFTLIELLVVIAVIALLGAEELRTDELNVYEHIVPEPMHRICIA